MDLVEMLPGQERGLQHRPKEILPGQERGLQHRPSGNVTGSG